MTNNKQNKKKSGDPVVYVPPDTKLNLDRKNMEPPKVQYEDRKEYFHQSAVKKFVKGKYGNSRG